MPSAFAPGNNNRRNRNTKADGLVEPPADYEPHKIGFVILFLLGLPLTGFVYGGTAAAWYLLVIAIVGVIATILMPRSAKVRIARLIAAVVALLLIVWLCLTPFPKAAADFYSPIAQGLLNGGTGGSALLLAAWLLALVVALGVSIWLWWTKKVGWIIASAFALPLAAIPFIGMFAQALIVDM